MLKTPARLLTARTMRGPTLKQARLLRPHKLCQSKTLSSPDFESTYTNKVPFGALAVC